MLLWTDPTEVLDRTLEDEIEAQVVTLRDRQELRNTADQARWRRERDALSSSKSSPVFGKGEKAISWTILGICSVYILAHAFAAVWRWTR